MDVSCPFAVVLVLLGQVAPDDPAPPHERGVPVRLDAGPALSGWRALGDARWVGEGDTILGEVGGGSQSFLVTEREFGDFVLDVDVKPERPGNSGIQVRSHVHPEKGHLYGYQIEIDSSERAWSGGLYDESRRGWLDDLSDNPAGRAAFRTGEWNHYRIECVGPSIRAWVNGVPTADWLDAEDLSGVIGLQVHSGDDTRVRWRNPVLHDLGRHVWEELSLTDRDLWRGSVEGSEGRSASAGGWSPMQDGVRFEGSENTGAFGVWELQGPAADGTWRLSLEVSAPTTLEVELGPPPVSVPIDAAGVHVLTVLQYGDRTQVSLDGRAVWHAPPDWRRGDPTALAVRVPEGTTLRRVEQLVAAAPR